MSVKISQLPQITSIQANTANTIFVGVDTVLGITGKYSATTIAAGLYANNILTVGVNQQNLPNTIAQFSLGGDSYIQTNLVNTNDGGTADWVATANAGSGGTDSAYFVDMGITNKNYVPGSEFNNIGNAVSPLDSYIYGQGLNGTSAGGNLIVGATTTNKTVKVIAGGGAASNIIATFSSTGLTMNTGMNITTTNNIFANTITTTTGNLNLDASGTYDVVVTTGTQLLVLDTTTSSSNSSGAIIVSGGLGLTGNVYSGGVYITGSGNGITFTDGTVQTTAGSSVANTIALQGGLNSANANIALLQGAMNTANANIAAILTVNSTQNTNIQSAWNLANTSLQNTITITANSNLIIPGNLTVSNAVSISGNVNIQAQTQTSANTPALRISGALNYASLVPLNTGYMIQVTGYANTSSRIVNDAFGANVYPAYIGRSSRGNATVQTATQNNDVLLRIAGNGYANSYSQFGQSRIDFVAEENFTDTSKGTRIEFWNSPIGSNVLNKIATFNANTVTFIGTVNPQKGFIWSPNVYPGAQTAITIDFANSAVIRANTSAGLTVSFSNYTFGKVVDMWITNTAAFGQTFTHGCSALNSTVNATTYAIPGTSTIYVKYMSFGTDLANTFVSITHA